MLQTWESICRKVIIVTITFAETLLGPQSFYFFISSLQIGCEFQYMH